MSPISGLLFLLPLTLFCLSLHPHPTAAAKINATLISKDLTAPAKTNATTNTNATSLISKACGGSPRKDFCLSLLKSNPDSKTADLKGLAFIALKAASKNATATSVKIKMWLNDTKVEPALDDGLRSCDDVYGDVVDQIEDSIDALVSNALGDVQTWMKAAIADIDTCEVGLKGQTLAHALELSKKNRLLRQLCNTALGIVHVVGRN